MRGNGNGRRSQVTVTGGAGYIGSVVVRELLDRGHKVRALDNLLYGDASLRELADHPDFQLVRGDIRDPQDLGRAIEGSRAVLHLAGLVGDPACAIDPEYTVAVNQHSTTAVAEACLEHEVERVIFASTCSVYGAAGESWLDEESPTAPLSLYAETNLRGEEILHERLDGGPALSVMRFATVYGVSPRMRFDLVVNTLTAQAQDGGALQVHGGEQWRPHVHVHDVARALCLGLEQTPENARGTFNVGSDDLNLRIGELAERLAECFPGVRLHIAEVRDARSYRVSFRRLRERWGFTPAHRLEDGVRDIADLVTRERLDPQEPRFHNVRALEHHLRRASA